MRTLTVKTVPEEIYRAVSARAAKHGLSVEEEIINILESAVRREGHVKLGSLLSEIGREVKLTEEEFACFEKVRAQTCTRMKSFQP